MYLHQQTLPYEKRAGATRETYRQVEKKIYDSIREGKYQRKILYQYMLHEFQKIEKIERNVKRIGVTGEVYMKYSSLGNHGLEEYLYQNACEPYFGGFMNYCLFVADSEKRMWLLSHQSKIVKRIFECGLHFLEKPQTEMFQFVRENSDYQVDCTFSELKQKIEGIVSEDCITGDGWLIAAEAVQAIEKGCRNVLIVHPFGCLVSHVCIRGIMKNLHKKYPDIVIQTVEYDYDSSDTLRESRILLGI